MSDQNSKWFKVLTFKRYNIICGMNWLYDNCILIYNDEYKTIPLDQKGIK